MLSDISVSVDTLIILFATSRKHMSTYLIKETTQWLRNKLILKYLSDLNYTFLFT